MPLPASIEDEVKIVKSRAEKVGKALKLPPTSLPEEEIRRLITIFRELRKGVTEDGRLKVKSPSGTLSTAEAISVINSGQALSVHFGDGTIKADDLAAGILGAVIKDPVQDKVVWEEYLETIIKERKDWKDLYRACKELG